MQGLQHKPIAAQGHNEICLIQLNGSIHLHQPRMRIACNIRITGKKGKFL
jgi:hypothetical protein